MPHILVVEDEQHLAFGIKFNLEAEGYEVSVAGDGPTALDVVVMDYVEAAKLRGERMGWIIFKEVLPNIMPPMITEFGLRFCFVFLTISALSFLGVGIQPPTADWGSMVAESKTLITFPVPKFPWIPAPFYPAIAIALLTVAINFVVDWFLHKTSGLRDEK